MAVPMLGMGWILGAFPNSDRAMKSILKLLALAWALGGVLPITLHADPGMDGASKSLHYLTGEEPAWAGFPNAPAPGSPADLTDLEITLSIQASRTPEQIAEAKRDEQYSVTLLTDVIDLAFATDYPKTYDLLLLADHDAGMINGMLKRRNARPRPYVGHPMLVTPLFSARDLSYPSGHSSGSELQARLLGTLFPEKSSDLLRRARQIADSRVIAGVHYASDTIEGEILGDLFFKELEANPRFQTDLTESAKADRIPLQNRAN